MNYKGVFRARFTNDLKSIEEDIYVVEDLARPLLGRNAAVNLKLISRVCELTSDDYKVQVMHEYPRLFTSMGQMEEEYTIKLKDGSKPFALSVPRKVPMAQGWHSRLVRGLGARDPEFDSRISHPSFLSV